MESDKVAVKKSSKECFSDRQDPVNFTTGEWCMEEEANLDILFRFTDLLTEHLREEHQMVVMNPNKVTILHVLDNGLGEEAVDFLICGPGGLVECDLTRVVMEKRPEDRV